MEERAIDRLRKFARYARDKGVVKMPKWKKTLRCWNGFCHSIREPR